MPETSHTLDVGAFKHIVVPIGVVIALGVARIVSAASHYIQHHQRVRFSVGHGLWCVILFLWFVGLWWIVWGLRQVDTALWSYFTLIFLLVGPCLLFLAASLLFGLAHFVPRRELLPWTAFTLAAGFGLGALYEVTGNLVAPVVAHFGVNAVNLRLLTRRNFGTPPAAPRSRPSPPLRPGAGPTPRP